MQFTPFTKPQQKPQKDNEFNAWAPIFQNWAELYKKDFSSLESNHNLIADKNIDDSFKKILTEFGDGINVLLSSDKYQSKMKTYDDYVVSEMLELSSERCDNENELPDKSIVEFVEKKGGALDELQFDRSPKNKDLHFKNLTDCVDIFIENLKNHSNEGLPKDHNFVKGLGQILINGPLIVLHDMGLDGNVDDLLALIEIFVALKSLDNPKNDVYFISVGGDNSTRNKRARAVMKIFGEHKNLKIGQLYTKDYKEGRTVDTTNGFGAAASPFYDNIVLNTLIPDREPTLYVNTIRDIVEDWHGDQPELFSNIFTDEVKLALIGNIAPLQFPLAGPGKDNRVSESYVNQIFDPVKEKLENESDISLEVFCQGPGFNIPLWNAFSPAPMPPGKFLYSKGLSSELILEWNNPLAKIYYWDAQACPEYDASEWSANIWDKFKNSGTEIGSAISDLRSAALAQFWLTRGDSSFHSFTGLFGTDAIKQLNLEIDVLNKLHHADKEKNVDTLRKVLNDLLVKTKINKKGIKNVKAENFNLSGLTYGKNKKKTRQNKLNNLKRNIIEKEVGNMFNIGGSKKNTQKRGSKKNTQKRGSKKKIQ